MLMPAKPRSMGAVSTPIEQIYITHCLRDEGLYQQAGFTIRACSTRDPLQLRFALEYPTYEAPAGLRPEEVSSSSAPRRLALVRIPGGRNALIHSVRVPEDGRGRANNFFSHLLICSGLNVRDALASWASAAWAVRCHPEMEMDLPPLDELPQGDAIRDEAITAFLQPIVAATEEVPATRTCPERLRMDARRRRELLAAALRGILRVLQASPSDARGRFYIVAEPGLTALLLYAAARLLPEALTDQLTFSTYENAHRDLRTYRHARVVGTCASDPRKGLDDDFFTTRGYALDTFQHRFSVELHSESESALDEWIDLAARGEWATVDKVRHLLGKTNTTMVSFWEVRQAVRVSGRLVAGQADAGDLLTLKRASWGPAILDDYRELIWPLVRESSRTDEQVCQEFADVLREHAVELEEHAIRELKANPPGDWQSSWRLLHAVLQDDPARLRETRRRILPEPPYSAEMRLALLRELDRCQLSPLDQQLPWSALLKNCASEDLDRLAQSDLPRQWLVWALLHALVDPEARAEAVRRLHAGDDELVALFWEQFKLLKDEGQRRVVLTPLFPAEEPEGRAFLDRLLRGRPRLRAETLEWLLHVFHAFDGEGTEFWGRENRLGLLLDMLRELGGNADPIWDRLRAQIAHEVLLLGSGYQRTLLGELAAARDRPGPPLPPKVGQVLADWTLLREHFEKAAFVPESTRRAVIDACNRLHLDSIDVLTRYFARFLLPQEVNPVVLADFVGFFHTFFLAGMEHQDYSSRLIAWLQIVGACPDEARRATYQRYYLDKEIPLEFRWRLAKETHQAGRLLPAVYQAIAEQRPREAGEPSAAAPPSERTELVDELFQLSGLRVHDDRPASRVVSLARRASGPLISLAAGLLAASLCGLYKVPLQRTAGLVLFVPVVLALAESMALQSVARTLRGLCGGSSLGRRLGAELLAGLFLGLVCGLIGAGVAAVWSGSKQLALGLGIALTGGMTAAAGVGGALPAVLARLRCDRWIAAGPVARGIADLLALLLYFALGRWLLG